MKSGRPEPGEYAAYAQPDLDFVSGDDAVDVLTRQGDEVAALLRTLDDAAIANRSYAAGKWTLKEVIGHLIDDERILGYRILCIARGDQRPLAGFDENDYVAATSFESRPLGSLIDEYEVVRKSTIAMLRPLSQDEWLRRGITNGYEASVRGLAFHIAGHELHHLRVLREKYFGDD